jgi:uncharacterized protein (DUF1919 family)
VRVLDNVRRALRRRRLRATNFSIVANNCWGGEVYKDLGLRYASPFIGLFIYPDHYLRLLRDFDRLIRLPITFVDGDLTYPIGLLGKDVEIHFLHYRDVAEVREKWSRRAARLLAPGMQLYYKMCDRDGATAGHRADFLSLPMPNKVFFSASNAPSTIWVKENEAAGHVVDGVELFAAGLPHFDHVDWLNAGGLGQRRN